MTGRRSSGAGGRGAAAVAIVGPTAVGKTAVAVELCRRIDGDIVSIDSRQVYRGIETISNAPRRGELRGIRCHLVSVLDPGVKIDANIYREMARPILDQLAAARRTQVLTAGTGLYLKAVLEDLDLGGVAPVAAERARLEVAAATDLPALVARLRAVDPGVAAAIDTRNPVRVVRAMEIAARRGRGSTATASSGSAGGHAPRQGFERPIVAIKIGLDAPRTVLYHWIEDRVERMLQRGWRREVSRLLKAGVDPRSQAVSGIGVAELSDAAAGRMTVDDARTAIVKKTRNYAKRQLTWFRADPEVEWIDVTAMNRSDIVDQIRSKLQKP